MKSVQLLWRRLSNIKHKNRKVRVYGDYVLPLFCLFILHRMFFASCQEHEDLHALTHHVHGDGVCYLNANCICNSLPLRCAYRDARSPALLETSEIKNRHAFSRNRSKLCVCVCVRARAFTYVHTQKRNATSVSHRRIESNHFYFAANARVCRSSGDELEARALCEILLRTLK